MNEFEYVYTRTRRELGAPCNFRGTPAVCINFTKGNPDVLSRMVHVNPSTLVIDNIPAMSCHSVNTARVVSESREQTHSEGGWPKEIDPSEPQDTSKWRKRLDKDPQFSAAVSGLTRDMSRYIERNSSIDMFEEYFVGESAEPEMHTLQASTMALFKDPVLGSSRSVSRISWHPDGPSRFISSFSLLKFQKVDLDSFPASSYVWETEKPNEALFVFHSPAPLVVTQYYARNADLVSGGGMDGLVHFFDMRTGSKPVSSSPFEQSHHDPILDLSWLQSKTHSELATTSPDGRVLWWDTRNLAAPTETCVLSDGARTYSGCSLEWQQEAGPTKYLVGTEEGIALSLTKKPKKAVEVGGWFGAEDHGGQLRHFGPIYSVKRNMFHPKYFLTVGDWGARLWLEELRAPLFQTAPSAAQLTCGGWSPSRAGLFYLCRFDGVVDFHDYNYQMNEVVYSHKIGDSAISSCSIDNTGRFMAVGDCAGTVTLVELCDELAVATSSEKGNVGSVFEREQRRERNLDALKKQQKPAAVDNKTLFAANTIDQQQYIGREKEWLGAAGLADRDWDLTVKAALN